jgi:hypothetical protein
MVWDFRILGWFGSFPSTSGSTLLMWRREDLMSERSRVTENDSSPIRFHAVQIDLRPITRECSLNHWMEKGMKYRLEKHTVFVSSGVA